MADIAPGRFEPVALPATQKEKPRYIAADLVAHGVEKRDIEPLHAVHIDAARRLPQSMSQGAAMPINLPQP